MTSLYRTLLKELADIESRQSDQTLSSSDRECLDQAWKAAMTRLDELESRPATPVPSSPVLFAPPPPPGAPRKPVSTIRRVGITRDGKLMAEQPDGSWVPAPPLATPVAVPPHWSLKIQIPQGMGPSTAAPPPPRARICNCDGDGECSYCEEERWNQMEDEREGCKHCQGCSYCKEDAYDGDEA